jgi:hypothetical protein
MLFVEVVAAQVLDGLHQRRRSGKRAQSFLDGSFQLLHQRVQEFPLRQLQSQPRPVMITEPGVQVILVCGLVGAIVILCAPTRMPTRLDACL